MKWMRKKKTPKGLAVSDRYRALDGPLLHAPLYIALYDQPELPTSKLLQHLKRVVQSDLLDADAAPAMHVLLTLFARCLPTLTRDSWAQLQEQVIPYLIRWSEQDITWVDTWIKQHHALPKAHASDIRVMLLQILQAQIQRQEPDAPWDKRWDPLIPDLDEQDWMAILAQHSDAASPQAFPPALYARLQRVTDASPMLRGMLALHVRHVFYEAQDASHLVERIPDGQDKAFAAAQTLMTTLLTPRATDVLAVDAFLTHYHQWLRLIQPGAEADLALSYPGPSLAKWADALWMLTPTPGVSETASPCVWMDAALGTEAILPTDRSEPKRASITQRTAHLLGFFDDLAPRADDDLKALFTRHVVDRMTDELVDGHAEPVQALSTMQSLLGHALLQNEALPRVLAANMATHAEHPDVLAVLMGSMSGLSPSLQTSTYRALAAQPGMMATAIEQAWPTSACHELFVHVSSTDQALLLEHMLAPDLRVHDWGLLACLDRQDRLNVLVPFIKNDQAPTLTAKAHRRLLDQLFPRIPEGQRPRSGMTQPTDDVSETVFSCTWLWLQQGGTLSELHERLEQELGREGLAQRFSETYLIQANHIFRGEYSTLQLQDWLLQEPSHWLDLMEHGQVAEATGISREALLFQALQHMLKAQTSDEPKIKRWLNTMTQAVKQSLKELPQSILEQDRIRITLTTLNDPHLLDVYRARERAFSTTSYGAQKGKKPSTTPRITWIGRIFIGISMLSLAAMAIVGIPAIGLSTALLITGMVCLSWGRYRKRSSQLTRLPRAPVNNIGLPDGAPASQRADPGDQPVHEKPHASQSHGRRDHPSHR